MELHCIFFTLLHCKKHNNEEQSKSENKEKFNKAMHKIVGVLDKYVFSFFSQIQLLPQPCTSGSTYHIHTQTHTQMELQIQPLTVDEIIVKAIKASFCMTSCSDDTMATMGASPPHFIICSATSAGDNEE